MRSLHLSFLLCCCLFFAAQVADAAAPVLKLAHFKGLWRLNQEKSLPLAGSSAAFLEECRGMSFSVDDKTGIMRLEWPGAEVAEKKISVLKADARQLHARLNGFNRIMILEKSPASPEDEIIVRDREEALVFSRVRPPK